ncbi:MAG: hypothetical protein WCR27_06215 [Eubacteriales bacterium]
MKKFPKTLITLVAAGSLLLVAVPAFAATTPTNGSGFAKSTLSEKSNSVNSDKHNLLSGNKAGMKQGFEEMQKDSKGMKQGSNEMQQYAEQYPEYFDQLTDTKDQMKEARTELKSVQESLKEISITARENKDQETLDLIKAKSQSFRDEMPKLTQEERIALREEATTNQDAFIAALKSGDTTIIQENIDKIKAKQTEELAKIQNQLTILQEFVDSLS